MKIQQYLLVLLEVLFPYMLNADITEDIHFSHLVWRKDCRIVRFLRLIRIREGIYGLRRMMV